MNTSTNVVRLRQPEEFEDPLTDILRSGARRLLAQAVELEAEAFLARMQDLKLPDGASRSYASLIAETRPMIIGTRLRSRGTRAFYRVRVPQPTRATALKLCDKIRAVGGACVVLPS